MFADLMIRSPSPANLLTCDSVQFSQLGPPGGVWGIAPSSAGSINVSGLYNTNTLLGDKTCDFGATWSGPVNAGPLANAGLVTVGGRIALGGFVSANSQDGPGLNFISLAP